MMVAIDLEFLVLENREKFEVSRFTYKNKV